MRCPHCGQPRPTRYGVALTRTQIRVFDAVAQSGNYGITAEYLYHVVYRDRLKCDWPKSNNVIRVVVHQINDLFSDLGAEVRIVGNRSSINSRYRLVKVAA